MRIVIYILLFFATLFLGELLVKFFDIKNPFLNNLLFFILGVIPGYIGARFIFKKAIMHLINAYKLDKYLKKHKKNLSPKETEQLLNEIELSLKMAKSEFLK